MHGWIKIHRQLSINQLWLSQPFTDGQAWIDLLMLTNHHQGVINVRGVRLPIERGQVGWSEIKLAERWKWSRGKVRRFLKYLSKEEMIKMTQQINKVTTIITILNYDTYQMNDTTNRTTNGQQTDTNKKGNNDKNTIIPTLIPDSKQKTGVAEEMFGNFLKMYPGTKRKLTTEYQNFCKKHRDWKDVLPTLLPLLERQTDNRNKKKELGQFVPEWKNLSTWINNRCWEEEEHADEYENAKSNAPAFIARNPIATNN